jgi:hypothetical protein
MNFIVTLKNEYYNATVLEEFRGNLCGIRGNSISKKFLIRKTSIDETKIHLYPQTITQQFLMI